MAGVSNPLSAKHARSINEIAYRRLEEYRKKEEARRKALGPIGCLKEDIETVDARLDIWQEELRNKQSSAYLGSTYSIESCESQITAAEERLQELTDRLEVALLLEEID